ncbi:MAG: lytic murein transglycosylase [Cellvibrio sp.]|uniref:lytic murein transglycosylase n=1 Tax=Cellvibrio sp. TaxID=1965322 RepID=UPI0031B093B8
MKTIKNIFPFVCCLSLMSCAQAPESSNLEASSQATVTQTKAPTTQTSVASSAQPLKPPPMITAADFATCLVTFEEKAQQAGISKKTISNSLAKAKLNSRVLELDRQQPEFTTTFADYFNRRVTDKRIEQGQALLVKHQALLDRVSAQYGVPVPYLLAFWGLETNFGSYFGNIPVVDSLSTLACDPRRSTYFTGELISALRILDEGAIEPNKMIGSWAGAMGHVQFMPTAFLKNAVDYDGDGKRDLWNSTADAMASAAHFLQSLGWNPSERWGREVKLPANFPFLEAGLKNSKTISEWSKLGITQADKTPLPVADIKASLLVPSGYQGPAFLVYDNFNVIMRWNRSEFYALAVGHLADRIAGKEKLVQPPPEDAPRLHRDQVVALQEQLNKRGFDVGTPDGILGPGTRRGISEFQHQQGMIADGFPSKKVIGLLGVDVSAVKH